MIRKIHKRTNPYVQIDKRAIEDDRLSWKAKGLLAYLLSRPDDWQIRMEQLATVSTNGIEAVRSALQELQKHGYARLESARSADGRQILGKGWTIYELPPLTNGVDLDLSIGQGGNAKLPGTVYLVRLSSGRTKIGFTTNMKRRLSQLKAANEGLAALISEHPATLAHEQVLHRALWKQRDENEVYVLTAKETEQIQHALELEQGVGLSGFASYLKTTLGDAADPYTRVSPQCGNPTERKPDATNNDSLTNNEYRTKNEFNLEAEETPLLATVPGFPAAWAAYVEHRKKAIRIPLTDKATELLQAKLTQRPSDAVAALEMAIENGWRGLQWEWFDKAKTGGRTDRSHRPHRTGTDYVGLNEQNAI